MNDDPLTKDIGELPFFFGGGMPTRYGFWVNYNDLTATSLEIIASKGNHPKMALIQVSELL